MLPTTSCSDPFTTPPQASGKAALFGPVPLRRAYAPVLMLALLASYGI